MHTYNIYTQTIMCLLKYIFYRRLCRVAIQEFKSDIQYQETSNFFKRPPQRMMCVWEIDTNTSLQTIGNSNNVYHTFTETIKRRLRQQHTCMYVDKQLLNDCMVILQTAKKEAVIVHESSVDRRE